MSRIAAIHDRCAILIPAPATFIRSFTSATLFTRPAVNAHPELNSRIELLPPDQFLRHTAPALPDCCEKISAIPVAGRQQHEFVLRFRQTEPASCRGTIPSARGSIRSAR